MIRAIVPRICSSARISALHPTVSRAVVVNANQCMRFSGVIRTTVSDPQLYAQEADRVLDTIQERLEADDIDLAFDNEITFTGDVLNFKTARGTWVLNKHQVTKQLWLSSPISGPSKYNYHIPAGADPGSKDLKQLSGGKWLSERDDSTRLYDTLTGEFSNVFATSVEFDEEF